MSDFKFNEFVDILRRLRKECPWDREQTNDSIKMATIEEAYEALDAINNKDYKELKEELGDLLLHVVFHSVIAEEDGHFNLDEVVDGISKKLIRRHPHVFGDVTVEDTAEVMKNWEAIKLGEGKSSVLSGVPISMPALHRAFRMQEKAAKTGFEWQSLDQVKEKIIEERGELEEAEESGDFAKLEEEFGDYLFALTNYARFKKINPENALNLASKKFEQRFGFIESELAKENRNPSEASLEEMLELWNKSKSGG
ncbi:MAG: nucleoside triphosphate pyrophosphohydrolase [Ignavibacteriaceae bacterium]|nr:nucleoside triphosphate pyrophosphohydrolase [Ignavibacteriaceae bacterium]